MRLYTFMGNSPAEALQKAQQVCGKDAVIVSTKELKKKSISSPALHEIVVALEDKKEESKVDIRSFKNSSKNKSDTSIMLELSTQAKELSQRVQNSPQKNELSNIQKELNNFSQSDIKKEIDELNIKLNTLLLTISDLKKSDEDLLIPPEFIPIYQKLKSSGMKKSHIDEILKESIKEMPTYMKTSPSTISRYFQVLLKKMIPIRHEKLFIDGNKKIMMLVGPTGVGKTTTLAKLAARFSMEFGKKVAIVTLDSYRIGAVEQLYTYAKMLKVPIESALDEYDFKNSLNSLEYCDIILVDTVGSSPYDRAKLSKLYNICQNENYKIDISLVISANTKLEDLDDIYSNYSILDLDNTIVTKFDESKNFGNILSYAISNSLALSYFSFGQEVPDDLNSASSEILINLLFNGFKKESFDDEFKH